MVAIELTLIGWAYVLSCVAYKHYKMVWPCHKNIHHKCLQISCVAFVHRCQNVGPCSTPARPLHNELEGQQLLQDSDWGSRANEEAYIWGEGGGGGVMTDLCDARVGSIRLVAGGASQDIKAQGQRGLQNLPSSLEGFQGGGGVPVAVLQAGRCRRGDRPCMIEHKQ